MSCTCEARSTASSYEPARGAPRAPRSYLQDRLRCWLARDEVGRRHGGVALFRLLALVLRPRSFLDPATRGRKSRDPGIYCRTCASARGQSDCSEPTHSDSMKTTASRPGFGIYSLLPLVGLLAVSIPTMVNPHPWYDAPLLSFVRTAVEGLAGWSVILLFAAAAVAVRQCGEYALRWRVRRSSSCCP